MGLILGLTGPRYVGKTTVATILRQHGFWIGHPFNPGKYALQAYLVYIGVPEDEAIEMTHGKLKDTPSKYLPENQTCRYLMEEAGFFWFNTLEPQGAWTIGVEIDRIRRKFPHGDMAFESIVYEADYFRKKGGIIIRIDGEQRGEAVATKSHDVQAAIVADYTLKNNGNSKSELRNQVLDLVEQIESEVKSNVVA